MAKLKANAETLRLAFDFLEKEMREQDAFQDQWESVTGRCFPKSLSELNAVLIDFGLSYSEIQSFQDFTPAVILDLLRTRTRGKSPSLLEFNPDENRIRYKGTWYEVTPNAFELLKRCSESSASVSRQSSRWRRATQPHC